MFETDERYLEKFRGVPLVDIDGDDFRAEEYLEEKNWRRAAFKIKGHLMLMNSDGIGRSNTHRFYNLKSSTGYELYIREDKHSGNKWIVEVYNGHVINTCIMAI